MAFFSLWERTSEVRMELPDRLRALVADRIRKAKHSAALSEDGSALLVSGGPGYGAYVSPDGDVFMETYDIDDASPPTVDRSERAQRMALVLGTKRIPELAELLPTRPDDATDCGACEGTGWRNLTPEVRILCLRCAGLRWTGVENGPLDHE